ncbi:MAG TPA: helix-turn-helix domain-containing protein [Dehalococcoidia bacterium]|nr:helix-turn-helix domain-containing protein [Dehalococcoidia bacterium]
MRERIDELKGLVHPGPAEATVARYLPSKWLASFVEHFWVARWHVTAGASTVSELTYPSVQLVVECHRSAVTSYVAGVVTGKFTKDLEGEGYVLGIKFRPGGFYPIMRSPVATLTDRRLPLRDLFGGGAGDLERATAAARDDTAMVEVAETFLERVLPADNARGYLVNAITDWICANRTVNRVGEVAGRFGLGRRALERLFRQYVGVPPKWVIQRYRLLDAVAELVASRDGEVGRLAADLGYFDQAHFTKDFKTSVGLTPAGYARRAGQH